jgi:hypothetical protein
MSDFSKKNSHEENIKISIDKILGSNTSLKRTKKTAEDQRRSLFINIINQLQALDNRALELHFNYSMDMTSYETPFFVVIEELLDMLFTKNQIGLINFYLYERITPEGFMLELHDNGVPIPMNNAEQLYEAILKRK